MPICSSIKQLELNPFETLVVVRKSKQNQVFFEKYFPRLLKKIGGYVQESQTSHCLRHYLEISGLTYVTYNRETTRVEFHQNDIVNNYSSNTGGYENSSKSLTRVEGIVAAIELLAELVI